ncbi:MAG: peptidoglycan -binding protein [Rhodospirillales bacterium]
MRAVSRRARQPDVTWPGFVDALATLLMVIIFLLMIFVLAQFVLNQAISGRDERLVRLEGRIEEMADLLALERKSNTELRANLGTVSRELSASIGERDELQARVIVLDGEAGALRGALADKTEESEAMALEIADLAGLRERLRTEIAELTDNLEAAEALRRKRDAVIEETGKKLAETGMELRQRETALAAEREISAESRAELVLVNRQLTALREQLAQLNQALEASEVLNDDQKAEIRALGSRLNSALATKVQELARYRSEFFGRLREILGTRTDIEISGDRFVLQSEVLFEQGSGALGEAGKAQMNILAATLLEVTKSIPEDIDWMLRVDGHTDRVPISTPRYPSNWELSAARAISVVKHLTEAGLSADRLAAAGFGPNRPLDPADNEYAYRRNRRIEIKFDQR